MKKCDSCNQKHEGTCSKGFTPAVVEIHNPEELVLFHKVIVPAAMGTEKDTPATIGKYCNVLMVYEANGHAYLYSSDGVPSKIAFDSGGVIYVEEFPDVDKASVGFLYIDKNGSAAITNDNENWVAISGGSGGTSNFNQLSNRPKVDGQEMTNLTNIPLSLINSQISSLSSSLSSLARVAYTGQYADLLNEPTEFSNAEWNSMWS